VSSCATNMDIRERWAASDRVREMSSIRESPHGAARHPDSAWPEGDGRSEVSDVEARAVRGEIFRFPRLHAQVRSVIEERIAGGVYLPGQSLPPEVVLARELGVSRVTLREALRNLEDEGILSRRHGVGTFVEAPVPILRCVLSQNSGVTETIERSGMVAGTPEERWLLTVADVRAAKELACDPSGLVAVERLRTADGRPVVATEDFLPKDLFQDRQLLRRTIKEGLHGGSIYEFLARDLGIRAERASTRITPARAAPTLTRQLRIPRDSLVMLLEQTDFNSSGRPVMFSREYWIRNAIQFIVDRLPPDDRPVDGLPIPGATSD
jgi:GntR family transcriptional regulator